MSKIDILLIILLTLNAGRYLTYLLQGSASTYYIIMLVLNIVGLLIVGLTFMKKRRQET
ncbi:hypothetical protein [Jeotgalibacillus terrae]|uniref:LPXTG cell wall anchor domain-containing protein n=1 Tax=Jeotgalibacillus terrae TaxID=587735 RepID=A0ABW5ZK43_9BACL